MMDVLSSQTTSMKSLMAEKDESLQFLLNPVFPICGIGAVVGGSDCCKSTFLRQLAACVASEGEFLFWKPSPVHRRVLYVSTEDEESAMGRLLKRQNKTWQLSDEQAERVEFLFSCDCIPQKVEAVLGERRADLVIVDTFGDICKEDLSQSNNIRNLLNSFGDIARRYNCFILFAHHLRKSGEGSAASKFNILGSQAFEAKMRVVLELRRKPGSGNALQVRILKGNYLPFDYKQQVFELRLDENMCLFANKSCGNTTGEPSLFSDETPCGKTDNERKRAYPQNLETIVDLRNSGKSIREISELVPQSKSTVQRILKNIPEA